jgi:DNA adenine methylase
MPYCGGKQGLATRIVSLMDRHDHYVEPYFGGGSALFAKAPAAMETVNDIDGHLMTFWRVLRDRPHELAWAAGLTPHSRGEFIGTREVGAAVDELEVARRVWVQLTQGRAARLTRTGWRYVITDAAKHALPDYLDGYLERLIASASRLRGVSLEQQDGIDIIHAYDAPGTCFYVDPPYLGTARGRDVLYAHEMPDVEQHQRLLNALISCKGQVILSGYASPLYDEALSKWVRTEAPSRDQASRNRVEVLWINRMPHDPLPGLEIT